MKYAAILLPLLLLPSAYALNITNVEIIPQKPSAFGSFLAVVDTDDSDTSRVLWNLSEMGDLGSGSLVKTRDRRYFCFFSKEDNTLCGFSPLITSTFGRDPFTMTFKAVSASQSVTASKQIFVGNMPLKPRVNITENRVRIRVGTGSYTPEQIEYAVYNRQLERIVTGAMPFDLDRGYEASFSLQDGEYYLALSAQSEGNFGGEVFRLRVGQPSEMDYPLYSKAGISDVLKAGGQIIREDLSITNNVNRNYTNLSVIVPEKLSSYISILLPKNATAKALSSLRYTLVVKGLEGGLDARGRAMIKSNTTADGYIDVGYIDLNIIVTFISGGIPGGSQPLTIQPSSWFGSITLAGKEQPFTLTNPTTDAVRNINVIPSSGLAGIVTASSPQELPPGTSGPITFNAKPRSVGILEGTMQIDSSAGPLIFPVSLFVVADVAEDINSTREDYESLKKDLTDKIYEEILRGIEAEINEAEDLVSADASRAQAALSSAKGKIGVLKALGKKTTKSPSSTEGGSESPEANETTTTDGEGGLPLIPIGIGIVIILVIALVVLKFRKKGWEGDIGQTY
ncbi:MAG: hypothetical protein HYX24_03640 [Candidatus Aenigmarchaeota archaeon]|nr:hypothetical protein [Candidatus Aenigmarchaeota archaeon]